ncbi:MAG: FtsX-like permease family protein, partial [Flavobacterium sp.]|nr:FtsX-like permease family protein [Pedobacter sp.]
FLLSLGCINFINLTTANAVHRAKEIGIRKTLGSSKNELVIQFLSETLLLTSVATLLSVFLTPLILKAFSGFVPEELQFSLVREPGVFIFLLILISIVTVLAGFYPAMVLSGYKPVLVLKNQAFADSGKTRNAWIRKSLTISQFVIAQVFIMATVLVSKQISYSLNKDMGFKKDAIIYLDIHFGDTVQSHKYALMEKIRAIPEIAMMSLATSPPSSGSSWSGTIKFKDGKKEITTDVQQKFGDTNYVKLYNIKLLAGSNLEPSDTVTSFLINQTYARILGFKDPQQAIGKNLDWSSKQMPIRGVISDFNQRSLHESVKPLVIGSWPSSQSQISMLLVPQGEAGITWKSAISKVEKAFKEVYPQDDFEYKFVDQEIAKYYDGEKNISSLLKWATGLAVLISCLGLLGLVIYTTTQRTKEIGVRKVLGASVSHIVMMITKDFLVLILIAFAIAAPLAWLGMNKWLENFAYRTAISWWVFGLGISVMLLIAMITLGFQTIKAALANPVKSLRTE